MRNALRSRAARFLAAAIVVALFHSPTSPPITGPSSAEANFTNGPPSPGPNIVRIDNSLSRVISLDPEAGVFAIHGRVSGLTECTNTSTRVPVDIQIVRTPSDAQNLAFLLTGIDNEVAIYSGTDISQVSPFDPEKFCPFIANTTPLYTGTVEYRLHQNGQGSLLFQWVGEVTRTSDGARFHYVELQYAVAQGDEVNFIIESIRLQQIGQ